jgi:hypothetical protein
LLRRVGLNSLNGVSTRLRRQVLECAHVSMYLADATLDNLFMVPHAL